MQNDPSHDCCSSNPTSKDHSSLWPTAIHATLHCLTGCAIGEILGLIIGASIGFGMVGRMALGTGLAFVVGMSLAAIPVARRQNLSYSRALKIVFWGEVASITAMEIAMNGADYLFGGAQAAMSDWRFWVGMVVMLPAGYIVALPVNYWLIKKAVKAPCH